MAQKHKAPTQVTLVQEEKGAFAQWISTNWKMLAFAAAGISALILGSQLMGQKAVESRNAELDTLLAAVQSGDASQLEAASSSLAEAGLGSWADLMLVQLALSEERYDDAASLLSKLEANASPLLGMQMPLGSEGETRSILEHIRTCIDGSKEQLAATGVQLYNPAPPSGATRVVFDTDMGSIEVGLYDEKAPLHVANFLANVDAGTYEGTRFHRIISGFMIQGGNPNTTSEDRTQWIENPDDDEVLVPSEKENGLVHSPFVLAGAMKPDDTDSSQYQFYITEGHAHWLNEKHTVYGKVLLGEDIVRALASVPVDPQSNQPVTAPVLRSVRRL